MRKWIIVAFVMALVAGCQSTEEKAPVEEGTPAATTPAGSTGATTSGATTSGVTGTAGGPYSAAALKDPNNILSKRSIYFDYDEAAIKEQYRPIIEAHAKYLQVNKSARVTLQGHTDERGTREYNIALGQRRADAVKKMMVLLGAQEIQIETVSFGKEKPRREGHDETAWAENRRVDIVHAGE
ncbi:MAG TPA: peptidoglycan-associated lipoprotein Pal [Casimicrobiaceae bacterium]|nr:peptidoglycan-associated lipoprotein Pal [Casimicrobiaceae bacterium]